MSVTFEVKWEMRVYILARRLGPHFKLDVSGYAAHASMTSEDLEIAMRDPVKFVQGRANKGASAADQLGLPMIAADVEGEL